MSVEGSAMICQENVRSGGLKRCLERCRYVIDQAGEREAVILSMAEYDRLMEDLRDLALIAERRDDETVSFEDLKAELDSLWTDTA